jgi:hypothetical protein
MKLYSFAATVVTGLTSHIWNSLIALIHLDLSSPSAAHKVNITSYFFEKSAKSVLFLSKSLISGLPSGFKFLTFLTLAN